MSRSFSKRKPDADFHRFLRFLRPRLLALVVKLNFMFLTSKPDLTLQNFTGDQFLLFFLHGVPNNEGIWLEIHWELKWCDFQWVWGQRAMLHKNPLDDASIYELIDLTAKWHTLPIGIYPIISIPTRMEMDTNFHYNQQYRDGYIYITLYIKSAWEYCINGSFQWTRGTYRQYIPIDPAVSFSGLWYWRNGYLLKMDLDPWGVHIYIL